MLRMPSGPHDVSDVDLPLTQEEQDQVRRALDDLLHSPPLRSTAQCQQLLRYIVEHSLSGDLALLRERVIGKEVFGRRPDYEPGEDPVVRIRAADLRKRLALYYQSFASTPELRVDVPPGSYRATFTWRVETAPLPLATEPVEALSPSAEITAPVPALPALPELPPAAEPAKAAVVTGTPWSWRTALWTLAAVLFVCLVCAAGVWYVRANDPVRQFWSPMLAESKPVLISMGSNAVYRVGDHEIDNFIAQTGRDRQSSEGMEIYPPFRSDQSLGSTGLYAAPDSFVALGDVAAASRMIRTFTRFGKEIEERFPNDISFGEVREHPTVLIGGANNPTARELTRGLPFERRGRNRIEDRDHPGKGWELHAASDLHDTDDYAIVTRLAGKDDASPLVSVAGLGGHGTLAAAEFLCKPESVKALHQRLGPDWLKRNFQVILRIKIIDFKPVDTVIVDQRMW